MPAHSAAIPTHPILGPHGKSANKPVLRAA
jgi:hypothetical protein